ncbi:MAG TPA: sugar phosphate nucleotidyltransferase, partial [Desulfoprunum sp.]|nr:sugar phosphate nucleotidyltransferase [Desulfoprunum sp.]
MKVIILSAGQGKRLLPMTATLPKCLLPVQGKTIIEWQIDELHKCGIDDITVVVGYNADKVENLLQQRYGSTKIGT